MSERPTTERLAAIRQAWIEADYTVAELNIPTLKRDLAWLAAELLALRNAGERMVACFNRFDGAAFTARDELAAALAAAHGDTPKPGCPHIDHGEFTLCETERRRRAGAAEATEETTP